MVLFLTALFQLEIYAIQNSLEEAQVGQGKLNHF